MNLGGLQTSIAFFYKHGIVSAQVQVYVNNVGNMHGKRILVQESNFAFHVLCVDKGY